MGICVGTSLAGTYNAVPPPGADENWRPKRKVKKARRRRMEGTEGVGLFKKLRRGIKKGLKAGVKVHKVAIKASLKPVKVVAKAGKLAMRAMAKLAAKPIIMIVNKLAGRRAKYLAFQRTGNAVATADDKRAGGKWALGKLSKAGPVGKLAVKILKFTGGVTSGELSSLEGWSRTWKQDAAACGMTGAEIAAAAATIVGLVGKLMKSLNRPGEAPANPAAAAKQEQPSEETQPVIESSEAPTEEDTETETEEPTDEGG